MEAIKLKPLSEQPLMSQFFYIFGENYNWDQSRLVRTDKTVTDSETGQVYLLATPEEEGAYIIFKEAEKAYQEVIQKHFYDFKQTPIIDLWNSERWNEGLDKLKKPIGTIVEMTEAAYDHFFNCVPPKRMEGTAFCGGEPYTHNEKDQGIYLCAIRSNGKYFAQYGTVQQFDKRELFKNLPA